MSSELTNQNKEYKSSVNKLGFILHIIKKVTNYNFKG